MDARNTALLVIDMQNDFVEDGAIFEVKGIRDSLPQFSEFIAKCRELGVLVIYTRHRESKGKALRQNTHGWRIHKGIAPEQDIVLDKGKNDAFSGTALDRELRGREIRTVIITGTMTDICCNATAAGARLRGYGVVFCSDLTFTSKKEEHERILGEMGTSVRASKEILEALS